MSDLITRKAAKLCIFGVIEGDESEETLSALNAVAEAIQNIPAVDDVPVIHGHWIQPSNDDEDCNNFICSVSQMEGVDIEISWNV